MQKTLDKIISNKFRNLSGTNLNIKIPILESIISNLLIENVKHEKIESVKFSIKGNNRFTILAKVKVHDKWSKPNVNFMFKLEKFYDLTEDWFGIIAEIESEDCTIWIGGKPIIKKLKEGIEENLPSYLIMKHDTLRLNLSEVLKEYELEYLVNYVNRIKLSTEQNDLEENKLWMEFRLTI